MPTFVIELWRAEKYIEARDDAKRLINNIVELLKNG